MLHTLYTLNEAQKSSELVLDKSYYNIFDTRNFKSNRNMDDSFKDIHAEFVRVWHNTIRPFIDAMMNDHKIYLRTQVKNKTLIPEEAIYLKLHNLTQDNIKYFYTGSKGIRLMGIEDTVSPEYLLSVFSSPVYDPIHSEHYSVINIIINLGVLKTYKEDNTTINNILLRIANVVALAFIDDQLSTKHNVCINKVLDSTVLDSNKDIIILPESFNICDSKFIFNYYYTLFRCLLSVLNRDYLEEFTDYSSVIALPELFMFEPTEEELIRYKEKYDSMTDEEKRLYVNGISDKIYKIIWDLARMNRDVNDDEYIDICTDIMKSLHINLDQEFYEAQLEAEQEEEEEDNQDSNYEEEESYGIMEDSST